MYALCQRIVNTSCKRVRKNDAINLKVLLHDKNIVLTLYLRVFMLCYVKLPIPIAVHKPTSVRGIAGTYPTMPGEQDSRCDRHRHIHPHAERRIP